MTALQAACGGGDSDDNASAAVPPLVVPAVVAVSGVVVDGRLKFATVCYDLDDNNACDIGEPRAVTVADGKCVFDIAEATAVDKDTAAAAPVALARRFAQRNGGVWYAFKDGIVSEPTWSIRLNGSATDAMRAAPGIQ